MARAKRSRQGAAAARPVAFLHIPKTAGTSLIETVSRNFAADEIFRVERLDRPHQAVTAEIEAAIAGGKRFICGHFGYSTVAHLRAELDVFTMLRDPVQRVASLYRFWRTQMPGEDASEAARFVCHLARSVDFDVFLELRHPLIVSATRDEMCRMLCGHPTQYPTGLDAAELFQAARRTLDDMAFGLVGDMATSMRLLSRRLGINLMDSPRRNDTEHEPLPAGGDRIRERVMLHNLGDTLLFDHARASFARQARRAEVESLLDEIGERALTPLSGDGRGGFVWRPSARSASCRPARTERMANAWRGPIAPPGRAA